MSDRPGYLPYMSSLKWADKRQARLEIDSHRCQTCLHDGSQWRLEVHHKTYERLGDEDVWGDLITLCSQCHEAITTVFRRRRYDSQPVIVFEDVSQVQVRRSIHNGLEEGSVSFDRGRGTVDAQWQTRRSIEFNNKGYQAGLGQESQD